MKKTILILLATLSATVAFGQNRYKVTKDIALYDRPEMDALGVLVRSGSVIDISFQVGEFYLVILENKPRYLPKTSFEFLVKIDSSNNNPIPKGLEYRTVTAGDQLYSAGKLLLTGTLVGIGGGAVSYLLLNKGNPTLGIVCGIGTGIATLILQIVGYTKLIKAGEKLNIGTASSGIGLSFNLK